VVFIGEGEVETKPMLIGWGVEGADCLRALKSGVRNIEVTLQYTCMLVSTFLYYYITAINNSITICVRFSWPWGCLQMWSKLVM